MIPVQLTVLLGVPASGKTTLAQTLPNLHVIAPDEVRKRLTGSKSDQSRNEEAFALAHEELSKCLKAGTDVLFDATSLTRYSRECLLDIAAEHDAETRLIIVRTPFEECKARNAARLRDRVPDHIMDLMNFRLGRSLSELGYEPWDCVVNHWGGWK